MTSLQPAAITIVLRVDCVAYEAAHIPITHPVKTAGEEPAAVFCDRGHRFDSCSRHAEIDGSGALISHTSALPGPRQD
jgi:hypothetical protein